MYMKKVLSISVLIILVIVGAFLFKKYQGSKNTSSSTINFATNNNQPAQNQPVTVDKNPAGGNISNVVAPNVIVYKTKRDYSGLAWVYLSSDKTQVISFMDPKDILNQLPVKLNSGYYSGVLNMNTAIINIKIDAYSKMAHPLTPKQLFSLIINDSPFSEMYDCGSKGKIDVDHINSLIDTNKLGSECNKVI